MKNAILILILFSLSSCITKQGLRKSKKIKIKSIIEASYDVERSGILTRKDALIQQLESKDIFDEQENLIEYVMYNLDGSIYKKTIRNKKMKEAKSETYNKKGVLEFYDISKLTEQGELLEIKTYNPQGEVVSKLKNEYDSQWNIISMETTNIGTENTYKTTYEYDSNGNLINETAYKADGKIRDTRNYTQYDLKGNELVSNLLRSDGSFVRFTSKYDSHNNLINQIWHDEEDTEIHQNTFSYLYDENNNWLTMKRLSYGKLEHVWERRIEYYE